MKTLPEIPKFYSSFTSSDDRSEQAKKWFIKFIVQSYPQYFKKDHQEFWGALCESAQYSKFRLKNLIPMDDIPGNIQQAAVLVLFGCRYGLSPLRFLYYLAGEGRFNASEYLESEFVWFQDNHEEFDLAMENFFTSLTLPQQKLAYEISLLAAQFMTRLGHGEDYVLVVLKTLNALGRAVDKTPRLRTFFFKDIPICLYGLPELLKLVTTVQCNALGQSLAIKRVKKYIQMIPEEKQFQIPRTALLCRKLCVCLEDDSLKQITQQHLIEDCLLNESDFPNEFYTSTLFDAESINLCRVLFEQGFPETAGQLIAIFMEKNCSIDQFDSYDRNRLLQSLQSLSPFLSKQLHIEWKDNLQSEIIKKTKAEELSQEEQLQKLRESIDQQHEQKKVAGLDKFKQALENIRLDNK